MRNDELLRGAYDIHVHAAPDLIPRAQYMAEAYQDAAAAGMAGILFKDHCFPTYAAVSCLNHQQPDLATRAYSALVLNPTIGGFNPLAVEAALKAGTDMVCFPTYATDRHIQIRGKARLPLPLPGGFEGMSIRGADGLIIPEVYEILDLVREYDAVLATGHLSAEETLVLVELASERQLERILVSHASEPVPGLDVEDQRRAAAQGAIIEHSLLVCSASMTNPVPVSVVLEQARAIGFDRVIFSSDYGKLSLGPVVKGFAAALQSCLEAGLKDHEMDMAIRHNPEAMLATRGK